MWTAMETENQARNKIPITVLILICFSDVHMPIYCNNICTFFTLEDKNPSAFFQTEILISTLENRIVF